MHTPILIVGAGPFGLSLSAHLKENGIAHTVVGYSMDYWKGHMPSEMYLRSNTRWHLDADDKHTILKFLESQNLKPADVEPLRLDFYLRYAEWFQQQKGISPIPAWIKQLDHDGNQFNAHLDDGTDIQSEQIVLAVGLRYFKNIPDPYPKILPPERFHHTAELVDFTMLKNKRILIVGGRQSAFEWAALIREKEAEEIHLVYRHETPVFTESHWDWVTPLLDTIAENPAYFRNLPAKEKDDLVKRMWSEGREKLEPWLAERITHNNVRLHPRTHPLKCETNPVGDIKITLSDNQIIPIDHIVLATGYKMDIMRVPLITNSNIASKLETRNGFPVLDETFQSSIPGLRFTGLPASQDFGPFFGFTAAAITSSKIIGRALNKSF